MTPTPEYELPADAVPGLAEYSAAEQRRRFAPPAGFADRATTAALRQRSRRVQRQWAVGLSLAATVLAAVGVYLSGAFNTGPAEVVESPKANPPVAIAEPAPAKVREQWAEAGAALESLTRKTTDAAVAPTLALWDSAARAALPPPRPADPADPTLVLAALPDAARSSLDPMTNTTRRAMNRLLKDVGLRAN